MSKHQPITPTPAWQQVELRMGAAGVINLLVAEWAMRTRPAPPARRAAGVARRH